MSEELLQKEVGFEGLSIGGPLNGTRFWGHQTSKVIELGKHPSFGVNNQVVEVGDDQIYPLGVIQFNSIGGIQQCRPYNISIYVFHLPRQGF